jgi:hypothetical protein
LANEALTEIAADAERAIHEVEIGLPAEFPKKIHRSVKKGINARLKWIFE